MRIKSFKDNKMHLPLMCLPGPFPIQDIVSAGRLYLSKQEKKFILYMPAADIQLNNTFLDITKEAFKDYARIDVLDLSTVMCGNTILTKVDRKDDRHVTGYCFLPRKRP